MDKLSDKALIVYASLDMLEAKDNKTKVNVYSVLDFIGEHEELQEHPLLKNITEFDFVNIVMEINVKSIVACLTALAKKDIVVKTEPSNYKIDGITRSLKSYYLKKTLQIEE
jgi:hypothetical protein